MNPNGEGRCFNAAYALLKSKRDLLQPLALAEDYSTALPLIYGAGEKARIYFVDFFDSEGGMSFAEMGNYFSEFREFLKGVEVSK